MWPQGSTTISTSWSRQTLQTNLEFGLPTDITLLLAIAMGGVAGWEVEFLLSGVLIRGGRAALTTLKRGQMKYYPR